MYSNVLEATRQAVALFFPDAKVFQHGKVIEIVHSGEIPAHFIALLSTSFFKGYGNSLILIDRHLALGKLLRPGMISDYLLGLYNDLCDKRDEAGIDRGWLDYYLYRMDHLYNIGDFMPDKEFNKHYDTQK